MYILPVKIKYLQWVFSLLLIVFYQNFTVFEDVLRLELFHSYEWSNFLWRERERALLSVACFSPWTKSLSPRSSAWVRDNSMLHSSFKNWVLSRWWGEGRGAAVRGCSLLSAWSPILSHDPRQPTGTPVFLPVPHPGYTLHFMCGC